MKRSHQEVDELRKRGAFKEALDLARYAHSQTPNHRILKKSYRWALYSYLKSKISQAQEQAQQGLLTPQEIVNASQPRIIEINQLCREYRVQKLDTANLCYSLLLRSLCRLSPPPLGLYGLLKWSRSSGLRSEDYEEHEVVHKDLESSEPIILPPLITLLARSLESLTIAIDQCTETSAILSSLAEGEVASLAAKVYLRAEEKLSAEAMASQNLGEANFIWRALWLSRRAGEFEQGHVCALKLLTQANPPASTWWELALCLAMQSKIDPYVMCLDQGKRSDDLKSAYFCALNSIVQAKKSGLTDSVMIKVYACIGYWAYELGLHQEARASLTWAIELTEQLSLPVPYSWVRDLALIGGRLSHSIDIFSEMRIEMNKYVPYWLNAQLKR